MVHALKLRRWPQAQAQQHWQHEAVTFLGEAQDRYRRSMARELDLALLFGRARQRVLALDEATPGKPLPETTRLTLEALMDQAGDLRALVRALGGD